METKRKPKKTAQKGGSRPGAGRPALPIHEARKCRIAVRLTQGEMATLEREAAGTLLSEYVRAKLLR